MPARLFLLILVLAAAPAAAQPADGTLAVDGLVGYAAFLDDAPIEHGVFGASTRVYLTPGLSIGPEVVYMRGPREDRDLFVTANLTYDFVPLRNGRQGAFGAFVVAGGGAMRHRDRFGTTTFASWDCAVTGGAGVRVWATDAVYLLAEFRAGWEPHYRLNGGVGVVWR
jgi:hypothetical protein